MGYPKSQGNVAKGLWTTLDHLVGEIQVLLMDI